LHEFFAEFEITGHDERSFVLFVFIM